MNVKNLVNRLIILLGMIAMNSSLQAQCANPTVMLSETFDGASPIPGAITANIYGGGSWTNAAYILSGNAHGWFNVVNGLGDVDVYDRTVNGFCIDSTVNVSFWTRHSFGSTNVTYSVIDDLGVVLATSTLDLTTTYQQVNYTFPATTAGLRFVIHCNSTGGNGVDIIMEDLLITHCATQLQENLNYNICSPQNTVDLFSLFSANMPAGGTWTGPSNLGNGGLGTFDPNSHANGIYSYAWDVQGCSPASTVSIQVMVPVELGPDTTICDGATLQLDAGPNYDGYLWSTGATTSSIDVTTADDYWVEVTTIMSNLVSNGGFENGNIDFTTGYGPGTGGAWGPLSTEGTYEIATSPSLAHNNFTPCGDHTSGTGNMMVVNGSGVPGTSVWCQTVSVSPNTDYDFSLWVTNALNDPNVANLEFYINGVQVGAPFSSSPFGCNWEQFSAAWNSGALSSADLCIVNQNTSVGGNDFALDEIFFGTSCTSYDTITVNVQTPVQVVTTIDPTCAGTSTGEIHVDNTDAIEYSMDGGTTWQADSFFVNLDQNTYTICSRTAIGCEICEMVTLTDPDLVILTVSNDTTICQNGEVMLQASATGGMTLEYHWDHTTDLGATQLVNPQTATNYTVYAENENGCVSTTESISVDLYPPLSGTISLFDTICPGESSMLIATATGGINQPYIFNWSSGDAFTGNGQHVITVSPAITTDYTVTITDGCESDPLVLTTNVFVAPVPEPSVLVLNPNQCEPGVFEIVNTTDPALNFTNIWTVNGIHQFLNQDTITTPSFVAGDYDVELTVISDQGCVNTLISTGLLHVDPIPTAHFNYSPNPVLMFNTQVVFSNSSSNAVSYEWTFEQGSPAQSTEVNPTSVFPDGQEGIYDVQLIATSELGCTDTTVVELIVYPEILIYAPNTFTPDGDEHNQTWKVSMEGIDIYDFNVLIFNRWGEVVWESNDISVGWDGTYNGKPAQDGVYTWAIETKDLLSDERYQFNGHLNIIR